MMAGRGTDLRSAAGGPTRHIPVLLLPVIEALEPKDGGIYLDGTFGAGGYTRAILDAADCIVVAIDRDRSAIEAARDEFNADAQRLVLAEGTFGDMETIADRAGYSNVDGIALDLGVSSMQLDTPERGFSFNHDGPLDMRMSPSGPSAADVVNTLSQGDLARVISVYGEERRAKAIARAIVAKRDDAEISRTSELAEIVTGVLGRRPGQKKHPATRTFQALRIFVNSELDELVAGLMAAERLLREGGRLAVVTFHSLEDRVVKRFFSARANPPSRPSRHLPLGEEEPHQPSFRLLNRRPTAPDDAETSANPRARSARLRAGERTAAPVHAQDLEDLGLPSIEVALQ